jgi:hypothetical protein
MATYLQDTFTGTNGTALSSHTPDVGGGTWSLFDGNSGVQINNNRIRHPGGSPEYTSIRHSAQLPSGIPIEVVGVIRVTSASGIIQLYGLMSNAATYSYYGASLRPDGTLELIWRPENGSESTIGTYALTLTPGQSYTITLRITATQKTILVDGVSRISVTHSGTSLTGVYYSGMLVHTSDTNPGGLELDSIEYRDIPAGGSPGTTTATPDTSSQVTVSHTAASFGTAPYTYQYQRAPDASGSPGTFANNGSALGPLADTVAPSNRVDTTVAASTVYWYRVAVTDSAGSPVTQNSTPVSVTTPAAPSRAAGTFYVSATGSDSNDGLSSSTPWQTLAKVTANDIVAGDTINLKGGDTFTGSLLINPSTPATATTPIKIQPYGTGRFRITPGNGYALKVQNTGYVTIDQFTIQGPGLSLSGTFPNMTSTTTSTQAGIVLHTTTSAFDLVGTTISNGEVYGCNEGILAGSTVTNATKGFHRLRILNVEVHDCAEAGISLWGSLPPNHMTNYNFVNKGCEFWKCNVHHIYGRTSVASCTGFPFIVFNAQDFLGEDCVAHHASEASNNSATNGSCGYIFSNAKNCTWRRCEAYEIRSPSPYDGNSFDFDAYCVGCACEYCYGHDVDGALAFNWDALSYSIPSSGNRYSDCIFVNGGRRSTANNAGGFSVVGTNTTQVLVENCIFYNPRGHASMGDLIYLEGNGKGRFVNNIFVVSAGAVFGNVRDSDMLGNTYWAHSGSTFSINRNSTACTNLAQLRATGAETFNGLPVGSYGDPLFTLAGDNTPRLPGLPLESFASYDAPTNSAARGAAIPSMLINGRFPSMLDWHFNVKASTPDATFSGYDSGPIRAGSTYRIPGAATPSVSVF